jgi:hypothetical protein
LLGVLICALGWLVSSVHSSGRAAQQGAAAAPEAFVRQITLATKDIIYDPATGSIYASVPSSAGSIGNSILPINPSAGTLGSSVFVGSEPGRLALSGNGQYIYVSLDGAAAVRRFDVATQTPGPQFSLGLDPTYGTLYPDDIAVMPGSPETIAISLKVPLWSPQQAGIAVYDNGVKRPAVMGRFNGGNSIEFSASPSTLYAYENEGFGNPSFRKVAVGAGGLTNVSSTSNLIPASREIKFDNGLIYAGSGEVINPETATAAGNFGAKGSSALVAPDSALGRVYFLSGSGSTWTLSAYDQNNFSLIGSVAVAGISGTPTSLVRWGTNGLAFRTSGNQVFLIQTSLVSTIEPIPTPTPTPAATPTPTPAPVATSIGRLALPTGDLIYDSTRQTLYASVTSAAGARGNSLTAINPLTGSLGPSHFVGSEPARMALSGDGQYLYVALDGAGGVRRFNLATQSAGLQFSLGNSPNGYGPLTVRDMKVLPDNSESVVLSRVRGSSYAPRFEGVAVYDNGVRRPTTTNNFGGAGALAFSDSPATLYGQDSETGTGFYKMTISASGVVNVSSTSFLANATDIKFSNGLVYTSGGQVFNPETLALVGSYAASGVMLLDAPNSRIYFLSGGNTKTIRAFDQHTFLPLGSISITNAPGTASSLVRWGTNGLAFRTSSNQVFLIQTALVPSPDQPGPPPSPSPTPTPTPVSYSVQQVMLPTGDIVYDRAGQTIYASVPADASSNANSLTPINPLTGALGASVFIGKEPGRLVISDDSRYLYVAQNLWPTPGVRRFDIASQTAGIEFTLGGNSSDGPFFVADMGVLPGNPAALVVARKNITNSGSNEGIAVYDDGVPRPAIAQSGLSAFNMIELSPSASTVYRFLPNDGNIGKVAIDSSGATNLSASDVPRLIWSATDIRFDNGRLYANSGLVADPEAGQLTGTFTGFFSDVFRPVVLSDSASGRVYFFVSSYDGIRVNGIIYAYDQRTFLPLGSINIGTLEDDETPTNFIRWGKNGLAVGTTRRVFLVRTSLVPVAGLQGDFDGDGRTDISVWQSDSGKWDIINSTDNSERLQFWGQSSLGDISAPGDFDGDRKTDIAIFRPSEGNWYIIKSGDGTAVIEGWGQSGDKPVAADYDGDGKTDIAVYRPQDGNWYVRKSTGGSLVQGWGDPTDKLVPGDYDGDGRADMAVYRPQDGNWYIKKSTGGLLQQQWGLSEDKPVQGDYDADGATDIAVFRPSEGNWYIIKSSGGATIRNWGDATDQPVPGDYDGDGKTDIAVWRPSQGTWYIIQSATNSGAQRYLGLSADTPIPSAYLPQ